MNKINWEVRIRNKTFWLSIIPVAFVLFHQVLNLFGVYIDFTSISDQLVDIVETVFMILGIIGIVNDPTTRGISDSERAMAYEVPR